THVGCDKTRPPGVNADAGLTGGSCWSDSQCNNPDAGTNGRCTPTGRLGSPFCLYDMCSTDVECAGSDVCSCGGPAAGPGRYPNECLASNCRVDSDCGPGAFCSPSLFCSGGTVGGYFCHSSCDECTNDSQCPSSGSIPGYCGWQPQVGRWACAVGPCPAG
ncbi:MAG TPA: hypothetical protein VIF15_19925, partial [Polyangiaceae bacterium]